MWRLRASCSALPPPERRTRTFSACLALAALMALLAGCGSSAPRAGSSPAPTPTPTPADPITALVLRALGGPTQQVTTTSSAADHTVTVTITLVGAKVPASDADVSAAQERIKTICFQAQRALWTSGMPLRQATVTVLGPALDAYADLSIQPYGTAVLTAATAAKLGWSSIGADAAWNDYDNVWLRPSFEDVS